MTRCFHASLVRLCALGALAIASVGCADQIALSDEIDFSLDLSFNPFADACEESAARDELGSPYVLGARVTVHANHSECEDGERSLELSSADESVLAAEPLDAGSTGKSSRTFRAERAGTTDLVVKDRAESSEEVHRAGVEVVAPTRVALVAHGPAIVGRADLAAVDEEVRVVAGGTVTLAADYFAADRRLSGTEVLAAEAEASSGLQVDVVSTFLSDRRDFMRVRAGEPGAFEVSVGTTHGGPLGAPLRVVVVPEDAIDRIELTGQDESNAEIGDQRTVLAQAFDAEGRPIFGVDYEWDLHGEAAPGTGDLFIYTFDGSPDELRARRGDKSASATIRAGEGFVSSSNHVGCAASGRQVRAGSTAAFALLVVALFGARRRVRRAAHARA